MIDIPPHERTTSLQQKFFLTALNLTTSEWITSSTNDEVVAGIVHLNLDSIFLDPNGSPDVVILLSKFSAYDLSEC